MTWPEAQFVARAGDSGTVYAYTPYDEDGAVVPVEDSVTVALLLGGLTVTASAEVPGSNPAAGHLLATMPSSVPAGYYAAEWVTVDAEGARRTFPARGHEIVLVRERAFDLGGEPPVAPDPDAVPTFIQPTQPNLPGQRYVWIDSTTGEQWFEDGS